MKRIIAHATFQGEKSMTEESRMKIKGKVVDYALLIAVGIGLFWCLYDALIGSDPLVLLVVLVTSAIYIVFLPKRHRQIQSYEQGKEAEG